MTKQTTIAKGWEKEAKKQLKQVLLNVEEEYGLGGLSDGLYGDYAKDVAMQFASQALSRQREEIVKQLRMEKRPLGRHDGHANDENIWCYECQDEIKGERTNNKPYNEAVDEFNRKLEELNV